MTRLHYSAIASLDGFIEDEGGEFGWAAPDEEVHSFANDLEREIGTHLYGRRMYETMAAWELDPSLAESSPVTADFASVWRDADKIVYSTTLTDVPTSRTRIEPRFDPVEVRDLKAEAERDLNVGGPGLAAHAFAAGLVDRCHLFLAPVAVGGGKPALPPGARISLELQEQRRFESGFVYLRYAVLGGAE